MNMRIVSLLSLLLSMSIIYCDDNDIRQLYTEPLTFISKQINEKVANVYMVKKNLKNLKDTLENMDRIIFLSQEKEKLESELVNLIKNEAFYYTYQLGLNKIMEDLVDNPDEDLTKEERFKELHDVINAIPSRAYPPNILNILFQQAENTHEDEDRAKDALHSVVEEIETRLIT